MYLLLFLLSLIGLYWFIQKILFPTKKVPNIKKNKFLTNLFYIDKNEKKRHIFALIDGSISNPKESHVKINNISMGNKLELINKNNIISTPYDPSIYYYLYELSKRFDNVKESIVINFKNPIKTKIQLKK